MNMKKKVIIAVISIFLLLFIIICFGGKRSPKKDFEYEINNGEVKITAYVGNDLKVYIPSKIERRPVTVTAARAFQEYDMTHVSIPNTVREIYEDAFDRCRQLKSIKWSKNLEYIGYSAFSYCRSLKKLDLPDSLLSIQDYAFYSSTVKKVSLPDGLEFIGLYAFANCENLDSLKIPDNTDMDFNEYTPWNYSIEGYDSICEFSCPVGKIEVGIYNDGKDYTVFHSSNNEYGITTELIISKNSIEYDRLIKYKENYGIRVTIE